MPKVQAIAMAKPLSQTIGIAIHIADNENRPGNNNLLQGSLGEVVATGFKFKK